MRKKLFLALALALAFTSGGRARAEAIDLAVEAPASKIEFVSNATLETIKGVCSALSGEVHFNPESLTKTRAKVALEVAALRTGLDLRDEHLRSENWLDANKFPHAVVHIEHVAGAEKLAPDHATEVTLRGTLTLHGITRPFDAKAKVRWTPPKPGTHAPHALHVVASFQVPLEAHGVSIPSIVSLKVAREILVNVDLHAHSR